MGLISDHRLKRVWKGLHSSTDARIGPYTSGHRRRFLHFLDIYFCIYSFNHFGNTALRECMHMGHPGQISIASLKA